MTIQEIHAALAERFGEAIGELDEDSKTPWFPVRDERWAEVAQALRDTPEFRFDQLKNLCGLDGPGDDRLAVVYHLFSYEHRHECGVKVFTNRDDAEVPSVMSVWPAANWHEREAFDLYGIRFTGHSDLRRMFLPDDWEGYPLRKDYVMPESYHGIPNVVE